MGSFYLKGENEYMITLIRMIIVKYYKTKWECAFWQFLDKELTTLTKNPEEIEKKIMPYLANLVHESVQLEKQKMTNGTYTEK